MNCDADSEMAENRVCESESGTDTGVNCDADNGTEERRVCESDSGTDAGVNCDADNGTAENRTCESDSGTDTGMNCDADGVTEENRTCESESGTDTGVNCDADSEMAENRACESESDADAGMKCEADNVTEEIRTYESESGTDADVKCDADSEMAENRTCESESGTDTGVNCDADNATEKISTYESDIDADAVMKCEADNVTEENKARESDNVTDKDRKSEVGKNADTDKERRTDKSTYKKTHIDIYKKAARPDYKGSSANKEKRKRKRGNSTDKGHERKIIEMKNVYFRYEKREKDVLRGLSFEVYENEIFTILGGNGSGKSTTLNILMGILKPQRGKLIIADNKRAAMVPQNPQALFTEITVEEEVYEGLLNEKTKLGFDAHLVMDDKEKIKITEEQLELMEIAHLRKSNPYDLSGGEQQRLALAKILAGHPDILFLDEPTKGLDPFFKRTLGNILKSLTEKGLTIILVSHDIDFCAEYGDRSGLFFDGEILAQSDAASFFRGNGYYTTTTNKIVREWESDIILCEEARAWLESIL